MTTGPLIGKSLQASPTVKDLQKTITWYVDVLGFKLDRRIEREGTLRGVEVSAGDVRIILNQDDDEIAQRIKEQGGALETEPKDMPWGARAFRFRDPDGFRWSISRPNATYSRA